MTDIKFKELDGDPVYDHLKTRTLEDWTFKGARIFDTHSRDPQGAKKMIECCVVSPKGKITTFEWNYNKLYRQLRRGEIPKIWSHI